MRRLIHYWYPVLVGMLLGFMQTGLFLQLSFTLSSSFRTYLMVTLSWLIGSAIGVYAFSHRPLKLFLVVSLVGYGGINLLLVVFPFRTEWWPLYALVVVLIGLYPGVFFGRVGRHYPARILFFRENNGFIAGLVTGTLLFMLVGRVVLWGLPLGMAIVLFTIPQGTFDRC
jgi:hypothetical protein